MRARHGLTSRHLLRVITALSFVVIDLEAQTPQNTPATTWPTYDVISIKPHAGDPNSSSMRQMPGDGIILVNGTVRTLIGRGYPGLVSEPIGLPAWATSEHYDVNATASVKNPTIEDRQAMMRALLAERFKLAAHLETQEQPSFDLMLARKDGRLGPGLKPSEIGCAARAAAQRAAADAARAAGTPPLTFTPPAPGSIVAPCTTRMMGNNVEGDFTMPVWRRSCARRPAATLWTRPV